jgi:hypothetical protein
MLFMILGERDDLHSELWHACAGPLVYVPRAGEKVLYFPQGHMEQVPFFLLLSPFFFSIVVFIYLFINHPSFLLTLFCF